MMTEDNIDEVVDLTDDTDDDYTHTETMTWPKIEIPEVSPSFSDIAPTLVPVPAAPCFNLREVASSYYAGLSPPILQPEVVPVITNVQGSVGVHQNICGQSSTEIENSNECSTEIENSNECSTETQTRPDLHQHIIGNNNYNRISKVSSDNITLVRDLETKNNRFINKIKNADMMHTKEKKRLTELISITRTTPRKGNPAPVQNRNRPRRAKNTDCKTLQNAALKEYFQKYPNPTLAEFIIIAAKTELSTTEVKRFYKRTVAASGKANVTAMVSEVEQERDFQHQPINNAAHTDTVYARRVKCIKDPERRTKAVEVIIGDIQNIGKCSLDQIQIILKRKWESKAKRLFNLSNLTRAKDERKRGVIANVHKEARRIKELVSKYVTLSQQQSVLVNKWKVDFIARQKQYYNTITEGEIRHVVEGLVMPWLVPFLYSKLTLQEGQNLTLEVALFDFCKVSNSPQEWRWETPLLLQDDDLTQSLTVASKIRPFASKLLN